MIDELIERVEKGEGADRRLDWDVLNATLAKGEGYAWDPKRGHEYTASLDAVLALIEEKLPGWACKMERNPAGLSWGAVWNRHSDKSAEAALADARSSLKKAQSDYDDLYEEYESMSDLSFNRGSLLDKIGHDIWGPAAKRLAQIAAPGAAMEE